MTYSYSTPLTYGPQQSVDYYNNSTYKKKSALPATITGTTLGAITGAIIGSRQNPYMSKSGKIKDSFVKSAFENSIENASGDLKEIYNGNLEILKKIDKVQSIDELKSLLNDNPKAHNHLTTKLEKDFLNNITESNLSNSKSIIKEQIKISNEQHLTNMSSSIEKCWDSDKKKFIKNSDISDDTYKAIKKASKGMKAGLIAKYIAIIASIAGISTFVLAKILGNRNSQ